VVLQCPKGVEPDPDSLFDAALIALYFSKVFHPYTVPVVVVDISQEALDRGRKRTAKKIQKGVDTGAFKPKQAEGMLGQLKFTADYSELEGADMVVEAATEDAPLKHRIFAQLESLCGPDAILASNSSHLEPERIFEGLENKRRAMVNHYFFPAERNPVVEVVPSQWTDPGITRYLLRMYEEVGKVPIRVGSRYGYAIDPIFEGLFQAAALCVEEGMGTPKEVDAATAKALGLGVGPFTAMNLTGGNPITAIGLDHYHEKIMPWFKAPKLLKDALESGDPWDVAKRGEKVEIPGDREEKIASSVTGAYLGLAGEILDSGIVSLPDLEMAVEQALVVRPPCALMDRIGHGKALGLVEEYAKGHEGFKVSNAIRAWAGGGKPWNVPVVLREDCDGVAVLTIRLYAGRLTRFPKKTKLR